MDKFVTNTNIGFRMTYRGAGDEFTSACQALEQASTIDEMVVEIEKLDGLGEIRSWDFRGIGAVIETNEKGEEVKKDNGVPDRIRIYETIETLRQKAIQQAREARQQGESA